MKTQKLTCNDADRHYKNGGYTSNTDWKIPKKINKFDNTFLERAMKILRDSNSHLNSHDINYEMIKIEQFTRKVSKLIKMYEVDFYKISNPFETWASRRRTLLNKLHTYSMTLERTKELCEKGKFAFSSITVMGSVASILFESLRLDWAHKAFLFSTVFGFLSLACSFFEKYQEKQCVEDVLRVFNDEKEEFQELERNIKRNVVKNDIRALFPYPINAEVVKELEELKIGTGETFTDQTEMIFLAILISNVENDINLLKDKEFIAKVKSFSKSKVAKIWWNRLNYKVSSHHAEKSKLYKEFKSSLLLRLDTFSMLPLTASSAHNSNYVPALGMLIIHSKLAYDAYCETSIRTAPEEIKIFKRLKRILSEEYKELKKVYNDLNPYKE